MGDLIVRAYFLIFYYLETIGSFLLSDFPIVRIKSLLNGYFGVYVHLLMNKHSF